MKSYRGTPPHNVQVVHHPEHDGATGYAVPLTHHVRHSPTGFSWGYGGSGPAELARCILIDHVCGPSVGVNVDLDCYVPPSLYQQFKSEVVATWPMGTGWDLTTEDVERWLAAKAGVC